MVRNSKLRNRILILVTEKERSLGRRITQKEIAQNIGVSEQLIGRWMKNKVKQFDGETIEKLCVYFNCEVGELLYIDRSN
jgi:DNA-binding Xre family transcriptional regulator